MEIKDKVVLITGSSSGIGQTAAIRFAKEGAKVVVNYRENLTGAKDIVKQIIDLGGSAISVQRDITKDDDIQKMVDITLEEYSTIDILINNVAFPNDRIPYFEASSDDIKFLINTDLIAPMCVTQHVLKIMQR